MAAHPSLFFSTILVLTFCALGNSIVNVTSVYHDANFDDLVPFPQSTEVGTPNSIPTPYMDLAFPGFFVVAASPTSILPAHSANNTALSVGGGSFTTIFNGSNTFSFDLYSVFLGCISPGGPGPVVPIACTVAFEGVKNVGCEVIMVSQLVSFDPGNETGSGNVSASMTKGVFTSIFNGLNYVNLTITSSGTSLSETVLLIDDVVYTAYIYGNATQGARRF